VNLLDLSALAVPSGFRGDGRPAGITLIGLAFVEVRLCAVGGALHHAAGLRLGASDEPTPPPLAPAGAAEGEIVLFCIGAHMSGLPLNGQVTSLGGRFLRADRTEAGYRLHALGNRPGLVRTPPSKARSGRSRRPNWAASGAGAAAAGPRDRESGIRPLPGLPRGSRRGGRGTGHHCP
jgi:allophanate hydrolase